MGQTVCDLAVDDKGAVIETFGGAFSEDADSIMMVVRETVDLLTGILGRPPAAMCTQIKADSLLCDNCHANFTEC